MPDIDAYIAGIGLSSSKNENAQISAAVKALLDAGVNCDDVDRGIAEESSASPQAFKNTSISWKTSRRNHGLDIALKLVRDEESQCVLVMEEELDNSYAFVIISEDFLFSRPFLKDTSARISLRDQPALSNFNDLCDIVWHLRGWHSRSNNEMTWSGYHLSRADGKNAPDWNAIEHKADGKDRLRHNPAKGSRDITQYDFESVLGRTGKSHSSINFKKKGGDRDTLAKL